MPILNRFKSHTFRCWWKLHRKECYDRPLSGYNNTGNVRLPARYSTELELCNLNVLSIFIRANFWLARITEITSAFGVESHNRKISANQTSHQTNDNIYWVSFLFPAIQLICNSTVSPHVNGSLSPNQLISLLLFPLKMTRNNYHRHILI